jgi:hypothetical protein
MLHVRFAFLAGFSPGSFERIWRIVSIIARIASGPVERVDQGLNLDKLGPCSLCLVAIEGSGEHLCVRIPIFEHSISRVL